MVLEESLPRGRYRNHPILVGSRRHVGPFDFLFWIMWISFPRVANLIPLIPFGGGHMVRMLTHHCQNSITEVQPLENREDCGSDKRL